MAKRKIVLVVAIVILAAAAVLLSRVAGSETSVAFAQDPPTATPTNTGTITPTPTPTIIPGVYLYSSRLGTNNCLYAYYDGLTEAPYSFFKDTSGDVGFPMGASVSESVRICNFTGSTNYYEVVLDASATGWSYAVQASARSRQPYILYAPTPTWFSNPTGYCLGRVELGGGEINEYTAFLKSPSYWAGDDTAEFSLFAGSSSFCSGYFESHYQYDLALVGEATATALAATETAAAPTATPTRTPTPILTPTPDEGVEFESRQGTPEFAPLLILGFDSDPLATGTPTPASRMEFTSIDGTPVQAPYLDIGFSNADAATPDPAMTPTATPTAMPTDVTCIEPTPLPTQIITPGPSEPGSYALPIDDTFICDDQPTQNFGNVSTMSLNDGCSLLLRWPLSAQVVSQTGVARAVLRLFVLGQPVANAGDSVFFVNETLSPRWTELGATWQQRRPSYNWSTAGARGAGTDYETDVMGYMYVSGATGGWVDIELSPAMVQSWISSPGENMGVVVWSATAQNDVRIASSEWYDVGYRPQLVLTVQ